MPCAQGGGEAEWLWGVDAILQLSGCVSGTVALQQAGADPNHPRVALGKAARPRRPKSGALAAGCTTLPRARFFLSLGKD